MRTTQWLTCLPVCLLVSCATPYQKLDYTGGHQFGRTGTNTFVVAFLANAYTPYRKASDFAWLRAAEVTLEHGYKWFTVVGERDVSGEGSMQLPTVSSTTGVYSGNTFSATTTHMPATMHLKYPGTELAIECYMEPPTGAHVSKSYDAAVVVKDIKKKYLLKQNSPAR